MRVCEIHLENMTVQSINFEKLSLCAADGGEAEGCVLKTEKFFVYISYEEKKCGMHIYFSEDDVHSESLQRVQFDHCSRIFFFALN